MEKSLKNWENDIPKTSAHPPNKETRNDRAAFNAYLVANRAPKRKAGDDDAHCSDDYLQMKPTDDDGERAPPKLRYDGFRCLLQSS